MKTITLMSVAGGSDGRALVVVKPPVEAEGSYILTVSYCGIVGDNHEWHYHLEAVDGEDLTPYEAARLSDVLECIIDELAEVAERDTDDWS